MALLEPLYKVSEICSTFGVDTAVVCPGSRSAALTLAFTRNSKIDTRVITDERSAAFVALGMAQVSKKPVVLICTSGTAGLNFAPAVAEAYFQRIPLRPTDHPSGLTNMTVKLFSSKISSEITLLNRMIFRWIIRIRTAFGKQNA
jgi:2-succinyl-5-enolpyruvyl-6-hydroxy-3-cyclohexene-1-carboxylate synthase